MSSFEWDDEKNRQNRDKHNLSFEEAQFAFKDKKRVIIEDNEHSTEAEKRFFCIGKVGTKICTVRFTYRKHIIRIIGAGYWRKGKIRYEKENKK